MQNEWLKRINQRNLDIAVAIVNRLTLEQMAMLADQIQDYLAYIEREVESE